MEVYYKMIWKFKAKGNCRVKLACLSMIQSQASNSFSFVAGVWKGLALPKVEILYWLALLGKFSTRDLLFRRGIMNFYTIVLFVILLWKQITICSCIASSLSLFGVIFANGGFWVGVFLTV